MVAAGLERPLVIASRVIVQAVDTLVPDQKTASVEFVQVAHQVRAAHRARAALAVPVAQVARLAGYEVRVCVGYHRAPVRPQGVYHLGRP